MRKPRDGDTVKYMRDYIRSKKLNKPEIKLGMKKAELIAGLKKHGHYEGSGKVSKEDFSKARQQLAKAVAKPPTKKPKKKIVGTQKKLGTKVKKQAPKKPAPKKPAPKKKQAGGNTVAGQLLDLPSDISQMINNQVLIKKATRNYDTFLSIMEDNEDFIEERAERENNLIDQYGWGSDFERIKRIGGIRNKRADYYNELTESQQETFQMTAFEQSHKDHDEYIEVLWKENIKGKNFSSLKVMMNKFMNVYENS